MLYSYKALSRVSLAVWDPEKRLAKLVLARGNVFETVGTIGDDGEKYIRFEEALFLLERGTLELMHKDTGMPITVLGAYRILTGLCCAQEKDAAIVQDPKSGFYSPYASYRTFAYLRRNGVVARFGKPLVYPMPAKAPREALLPRAIVAQGTKRSSRHRPSAGRPSKLRRLGWKGRQSATGSSLNASRDWFVAKCDWTRGVVKTEQVKDATVLGSVVAAASEAKDAANAQAKIVEEAFKSLQSIAAVNIADIGPSFVGRDAERVQSLDSFDVWSMRKNATGCVGRKGARKPPDLRMAVAPKDISPAECLYTLVKSMASEVQAGAGSRRAMLSTVSRSGIVRCYASTFVVLKNLNES